MRDSQVLEGNSGSTAQLIFQVDLSTRSGQAVSIDYATSNGTATAGSDYGSTTGTLVISPGNLSGTIAIAITGDNTSEGNETLTLTLTNPVGGTITRGTATGTIVDDDAGGAVTITGTSGNDTLRGNTATTGVPDEVFFGLEGNDNLFGYFGTNTFNGGSGADNLVGYSGQDTFVYSPFTDSVLNSMDTISRFSSVENDRIELLSNLNPTNLFYAGIITATSVSNAVTTAYGNANGSGTALGANEGVLFRYGTSSYYLGVNDSNTAFGATTDLLIKISSLVNAPTTPGALTVGNFFLPD